MDGNKFNADNQNDTAANAPSPPLADIISKLMSDPQILGTLSSLMGKGIDSDKPTEEKNDAQVASAPPSTDALASRLPQMMEALAPVLSSVGNEKKGSNGALNNILPKHDDKRICLLRAIKPYVSRGRGEAIDYMIQISKLSELMKHLN